MTHGVMTYHTVSNIKFRVRRIRNFCYSLRSKSKRIWILFASHLHISVYSQTPLNHIICFIFPSKCSHRFAYKYLIWCKKIRVAANIRLRFSHTGEYLLRIASNYLAKPFTRLWSQLIFGSFWKYSLRREYSLQLSVSHVKSTDSLRCETSDSLRSDSLRSE